MMVMIFTPFPPQKNSPSPHPPEYQIFSEASASPKHPAKKKKKLSTMHDDSERIDQKLNNPEGPKAFGKVTDHSLCNEGSFFEDSLFVSKEFCR